MPDNLDLQGWLHRELPQRDKLLLILATFDAPCQVRDLKRRGEAAGFRIPNGWNPSAVLARTSGLAIRLPGGWQLTEAGRDYLRGHGALESSPASRQVAKSLRAALEDVEDELSRSFIEEAVHAYEFGLHRAAVVMSWVGAISVLQKHVVANLLAAFNAEARRVDGRWKSARSIDGLSRMRESDFLERLVGLSVIGKDVKTELGNCLARRNSCGHPNSLRIGANTVAHHLEVLLLNVFARF